MKQVRANIAADSAEKCANQDDMSKLEQLELRETRHEGAVHDRVHRPRWVL
jgi:hypothetical protein